MKQTTFGCDSKESVLNKKKLPIGMEEADGVFSKGICGKREKFEF